MGNNNGNCYSEATIEKRELHTINNEKPDLKAILKSRETEMQVNSQNNLRSHFPEIEVLPNGKFIIIESEAYSIYSGTIRYKNGDKYKGHIRNSCAHGKGMMLYANKTLYQGEFKNDFKSGFRVFLYDNEETYVGQFSEDKPNGVGEFTYQNGNVFKGIFG